MKANRGFSLLELLIVVAIILIIATIAIPSMLRSRQAANESAAVAMVRTINTAQVSYSSSNSVYGTFAQLASAGLVDTRFVSSASISGYAFTLDLASNNLEYTLYANATGSATGRFDYYSAPDYVIRYSTAASRAPSGASGQPIH